MNIAFIIDRFDPEKGGAERWIGRMMAGLAARGHSLSLGAMDWYGPLPVPMECHRIAAPRFPRSVRDREFAARSAALLDSLRPDLSIGLRHVPSVDVFLALGGLYCETLRGNGRADPSRSRRWSRRLPKYRVLLDLERQFFARRPAPLVVTPSEMVKRQCADHYAFDPQRVAVVPHGVDLDMFRPADPGARAELRREWGIGDRVAALFVAHNFRLKGLPCLLEAWQRLDRGRFVLLVVGRERPPSSAARLPHVRFLGERRDVARLYQAADLLVHPVFYDVFPLVMMESLASGLPVITTRFNGAADLITDGREGFVVDDPRRTGILVDRIERFADPAVRRRFSVAARQLAERYPEGKCLDQTLDAIETEAKRPRHLPTVGDGGRNGRVRRMRLGGLTWRACATDLSSSLRAILEDPDGFLESKAEILKSDRTTTVGRGDGWVLKRYNFRLTAIAMKDWFRSSRAGRAWRHARLLEAACIPTAHPAAVAVRWKSGLLRRGYLVMEEIDGATRLRDCRAGRREAVRRVAYLVAGLHDRGFRHRDLKEPNILLDTRGQPWLIDLEGLRQVGMVSDAQAVRDLSRLARDGLALRQVSRGDRVRFLKTYCDCRGKTGLATVVERHRSGDAAKMG